MSAAEPTPAWPFFARPVDPPVKFDSLWCSEDNRIRVATIGAKHFVSVDGDNFNGPHKTMGAAREYGASITQPTGEKP